MGQPDTGKVDAVPDLEIVKTEYELSDLERKEAAEREERDKEAARGKSLSEVLSREVVPPVYLLDGLLTEGFTILAGRPKSGKSWLCLQLAHSLAVGVPFLGEFKPLNRTPDSTPTWSKVCYLAFEDSDNRLTYRTQTIGCLPSDDLVFYTQWPRGHAGISALHEYAKHHDVVIIDILQRVIGGDVDFNAYEQVMDIMGVLSDIWKSTGTSIIAVMHTRKRGKEGATLESVLGSQGFVAAVDNIAMLDRRAESKQGYLKIEQRDTFAVPDIAIELTEDHAWDYLGKGSDYRLSVTHSQIIDALREATDPVGPKDVASMADLDYGHAKSAMFKMEREGLIRKTSRGLYTAYDDE